VFTPSPDADTNLINEGISEECIYRVGNIMIDSYIMYQRKIAKSNILKRLKLIDKRILVTTFHRPANVDSYEKLASIVSSLSKVSKLLKVIFPVHPRTKEKLDQFQLTQKLLTEDIIITEPLGYIDFIRLVEKASVVITDSGGIQEETTYLGIPCLTIRENTERPITITQGTNKLTEIANIVSTVESTLNSSLFVDKKPELWDGKTAERVVNILKSNYDKGSYAT